MQNDPGLSAPSGSSKKSTVYVAGLVPEVDANQLLQTFATFGDIIDIKIPHEAQDLLMFFNANAATKHRGFAFITFSSASDAQDAIDNYDLNELPNYKGRGKILKCSLAQPDRFASEGGGNKFDRAIWASDEYQKQHGINQDQGEDGPTAVEGQ